MLQSVALQKSTKVVGLMKMVPPLSSAVATLPRIVSPLLLKLLNPLIVPPLEEVKSVMLLMP